MVAYLAASLGYSMYKILVPLNTLNFSVTTKHVCRHCLMSLGGTKTAWLITTSLGKPIKPSGSRKANAEQINKAPFL